MSAGAGAGGLDAVLAFREAVDKAAADGTAAGGSEERPASDYGFMYQRQLCDPDGNILEFGWMDPVAAEQGPEAMAQASAPQTSATQQA